MLPAPSYLSASSSFTQLYLVLLNIINITTNVLNNYGDGIYCRPRTII